MARGRAGSGVIRFMWKMYGSRFVASGVVYYCAAFIRGKGDEDEIWQVNVTADSQNLHPQVRAKRVMKRVSMKRVRP